MFLPDMRTIYLISMLVNLVLAISMLVCWRTQKTYEGFAHMVLSTGLVAVTFLLFAVRGWIPAGISILGANLAAGLALLYRLEGFRRFVGIKKFRRVNLIPLAALLPTAFYFSFVQDSEFIRATVMTIVIIYFIFDIIFTLAKAPNQSEKLLLRVIILMHAGYVLAIAGRILTWVLSATDMGLFSPSVINVGYFLYDLLNSIALAIVFIMLNGQRLTSHLTATQQALEQLATRDALTDLYNHRTLLERGQAELLRSQKLNSELALLMFDIDHFKHVNDTYGHAAGDKVLKSVGQHAVRACRNIDIVARMGGDEFVILLPDTSEENAGVVAERLRRSVAQECCEWGNCQIKVTLSIGLASLAPDDQEFETLLHRADEALYEAKHAGRDRLVVYDCGVQQFICDNLEK